MARGIALRIRYEVIVRDKNGKVLSREKRTCKSIVTNFAKWLRQWFTIMAGCTAASSFTMVDTGGVDRTFPPSAIACQGDLGQFGAGVNVDTVGIVVGTSNQAVTPADNKLIGKIAHGSGGGQLLHGTQSIEAVVVVGAVSSFRSTRVFTNNSGSLITVKEIGIYFGERETPTATIRYMLGVRDVLAVSKDVPDGFTMTVRYTVSVSA